MNPYTILLMDADETLLDFRRSEGYALETTLASHGIRMTAEMHDRYHEINRCLWQKLERGEMTRDRLKVQRFEEFFASIDAEDIDAAAFNAAYMRAIGTKGFMLCGATELLADLSRRYPIYIITNGTASVQHTRLADSGMLPFIKDVFISEEIGADKPSPRFFEKVLAAIGEPDKRELLIIGDSLTSDIRGGNLSGIDTCWYNPDGKPLVDDVEPTMTVSSFDEIRCMLL